MTTSNSIKGFPRFFNAAFILVSILMVACGPKDRAGLSLGSRNYVTSVPKCECDTGYDLALDFFVNLEQFSSEDLSTIIRSCNDSVLGVGFVNSSRHNSLMDKIEDELFEGDFGLVIDSTRIRVPARGLVEYGSKEIEPANINWTYTIHPNQPQYDLVSHSTTIGSFHITQSVFTCVNELGHAEFCREAYHKSNESRALYYEYPVKANIQYHLSIMNKGTGKKEFYSWVLLNGNFLGYSKALNF